MRKNVSKIRSEIARRQEQLKLAETREAERIGRIALKAGLGEIDADESRLLKAFQEMAGRFRESGEPQRRAATQPTGAPARPAGEG